MKRVSRGSRRGLVASILTLGLAASAPAIHRTNAQGQAEPAKSAVAKAPATFIEIRGAGARPLAISREDFARLPRRTVRAKGHDGVESDYEGVLLVEVLGKAGVPTGAELRGKALAHYVMVEAADGYRVAFALAELDPAFADRTIILADRRDGRPLSDREGPLQVVVPGEKKHGRWVRQVCRLVVGRG